MYSISLNKIYLICILKYIVSYEKNNFSEIEKKYFIKYEKYIKKKLNFAGLPRHRKPPRHGHGGRGHLYRGREEENLPQGLKGTHCQGPPLGLVLFKLIYFFNLFLYSFFEI